MKKFFIFIVLAVLFFSSCMYKEDNLLAASSDLNIPNSSVETAISLTEKPIPPESSTANDYFFPNGFDLYPFIVEGTPFIEGKGTAKREGLIDKDGNVIVEANYYEVLPFKSNVGVDYVLVRKWDGYPSQEYPWGQFGFIDRLGNEVIPCEYTSIDVGYIKNDSLIIAEKDNQYGIIDAHNNIVLAFEEYLYFGFECILDENNVLLGYQDVHAADMKGDVWSLDVKTQIFTPYLIGESQATYAEYLIENPSNHD